MRASRIIALAFGLLVASSYIANAAPAGMSPRLSTGKTVLRYPAVSTKTCAIVRGAEIPGAAKSALLVIQSGDAPPMTMCVRFTPQEERDGFSGADLLARSGLPIVYGGTRDNASVCRIDEVGCLSSNGSDCFCQCRNSATAACRFWGYYTIAGPSGEWKFSNRGPSQRLVKDGQIDGWRWGNHVDGASAPGLDARSMKPCAVGAVSSVGGMAGVAERGSSDATKKNALLPVLGLIALALLGGGAWNALRRRSGHEDA